MRGKVIPLRGTMTAQRPGTRLPTNTTGSRAHIFYYPVRGFDYLTQLPKRGGKDGGGELLFGGGAINARGLVLSEVAVADDGGHDLGIASHVQGALPEYFGLGNWGAEGADVSREAKEENGAWEQGRTKAVWTGILGMSADLQPWVGWVPSVISGRNAPPHLLTGSSDNAVAHSLAAPREWVSTGYSGEGMVHAWLCAHALALMVLGLENDEGVHTWFPDEFRLTEKRWKKATFEQLMAKY
jgi:glycine/D-amino acid oxidase-like deaminating enzyme